MTAFINWGAADLKDEVNGKDAWQGVRAKSSLLRLLKRKMLRRKICVNLYLHTELTTNIEIVNQTEFLNNGIR